MRRDILHSSLITHHWREAPHFTLPHDRNAPSATRARCSTAWPAAGPTGAGRAATSTARTTPAPSSTRCATCSPRRWARRTRRSGSTPACTGPTASTAPARATTTSITKTGELTKSKSRLRAPAAARLLHPERVRRPRQRRRHHGPVGARGAPVQVRLRHRLQLLALRGENEPLSGGGKSSGLMSFLKIGDRAAGAIKSGGTTRRAAKMVSSTSTTRTSSLHRLEGDRGAEGRRAGRRLQAAAKHLNAVIKACVTGEGLGNDASTRREEPGAARRDRARAQGRCARELHPARIQFAQARATGHRLPDLRHRLGFARPTHRLRPELEQLGARHRTSSSAPSKTTATGPDPPHRRQAVAKTRRPPASCGTRSPTPPGPAPIRACSTTPPSTSGTPARPTAASTPATRAPSTCSSTTRPATSRRST
jgi:hypothetical protein